MIKLDFTWHACVAPTLEVCIGAYNKGKWTKTLTSNKVITFWKIRIEGQGWWAMRATERPSSSLVSESKGGALPLDPAGGLHPQTPFCPSLTKFWLRPRKRRNLLIQLSHVCWSAIDSWSVSKSKYRKLFSVFVCRYFMMASIKLQRTTVCMW